MTDYDNIVRDRQKAIRREIDRRDIAIKSIQLDGGWKEPSTVLSYFPADQFKVPATMSVAALYRFIKTEALPIELLSMLLPEGFSIVRNPESIDHDEIDCLMRDYVATKAQAHHPESEAGREIGPGEDNVLRGKFARVAGAA